MDLTKITLLRSKNYKYRKNKTKLIISFVNKLTLYHFLED